MPRQSRNDPYQDRRRDQDVYGSGRRRNPYESRNAGNDDRYEREQWEDDDRGAGFADDQSDYYDREGRDYSRTFRENGRNRDRADRPGVTYDDSYRGRSRQGGYSWEGRGSEGAVLPAGPSAHRNEGRNEDRTHRGKGPKDYQRSDDRIREDVCDRLADDGTVDASDITVRVEKGEVTLEGQVDSRRAKRSAEDCVDSVSGVQHCQNNLRVSQNRNFQSSESSRQGSGNATETSGRKQKQN
jgi:osmotically-inducible protein OsmY